MAIILCQKWLLKKQTNQKQKNKTVFVKKLKISCSLDDTILVKFY